SRDKAAFFQVDILSARVDNVRRLSFDILLPLIRFPVKVIEQLMARSGMDLKMAKTCYHSHCAFAKHPHSDSNEVSLVTRKYRSQSSGREQAYNMIKTKDQGASTNKSISTKSRKQDSDLILWEFEDHTLGEMLASNLVFVTWKNLQEGSLRGRLLDSR
ncbi:hypothetical protein Tco_1073375, partial [Tanacetum coccineum]